MNTVMGIFGYKPENKSPEEETEYIDYNRMKNPPPWFHKPEVIQMEGTEKKEVKKVTVADDFENGPISKSDKIAYFIICGMTAAIGVGLCAVGVFIAPTIVGTILLEFLGIFFIAYSAALFDSVYRRETIENEEQKQVLI